MGNHSETPMGQLPPWLHSTQRLIESAFPDGVPENAYYPLLDLLGVNMSQRGLAEVMAYSTGQEYPRVYNDVLGVQSPYEPKKFTPAEWEEVKRKLTSCGYDGWLKEE